MNALDKITKARTGLILDMPFFGALSLRLTLKEDATCKTAWTDGKSLGYNPEFIDGLTLTETKGLVAHEVMHCAMHHQLRRAAREHRKWNEAADYAINGILDASRMTLPADALRDPAFDGKSAEDIYTRIPDPENENSGGNKKGNDPGGFGEVRDAKDEDGKPASPAEVERQAADWKIATSQAAQTARAMGAMPESLDRIIKEIVDAKVDWRETLRRFINTTAKNDYSWSPPNRRHIAAGLYLPSLRSEELKPIAVAVDTSGSIDNLAVSQFAAELNSILEEYNTTCYVMYVDTRVAGVEEFTRDDLPLVLHPRGGGGTDFRPAFNWIEENDMQPSCLVYLTDMQGVFPQAEPCYPVLWVNIGREAGAPFGEVVKI